MPIVKLKTYDHGTLDLNTAHISSIEYDRENNPIITMSDGEIIIALFSERAKLQEAINPNPAKRKGGQAPWKVYRNKE